jgi:hypothetical protein
MKTSTMIVSFISYLMFLFVSAAGGAPMETDSLRITSHRGSTITTARQIDLNGLRRVLQGEDNGEDEGAEDDQGEDEEEYDMESMSDIRIEAHDGAFTRSATDDLVFVSRLIATTPSLRVLFVEASFVSLDLAHPLLLTDTLPCLLHSVFYQMDL